MTTQTHELYLRTDPQRLWKALTDAEQTRQYFYGTSVRSTFQPGAPLEYTGGEGGPVMVAGQVLEVDPGKRWVHTWVVHYEPALAGETSKVTWLLEPRGENVKLTLTHDLSHAPLTAQHLASDGWSTVLSSLKSLVETGRALTLPPPPANA